MIFPELKAKNRLQLHYTKAELNIECTDSSHGERFIINTNPLLRLKGFIIWSSQRKQTSEVFSFCGLNILACPSFANYEDKQNQGLESTSKKQ